VCLCCWMQFICTLLNAYRFSCRMANFRLHSTTQTHPVLPVLKRFWILTSQHIKRLCIITGRTVDVNHYTKWFYPYRLTVYCIFISVINRLDAQHFCFTINLFHACTCFEHTCSKHVQAWNKLIVKQKFCASRLITEINILRCTVSKTINIQRCTVSKTINIQRCTVSKTINIQRCMVSKTLKAFVCFFLFSLRQPDDGREYWWLSLLKSIGGYHYWIVLVVITVEEYWWLSLLKSIGGYHYWRVLVVITTEEYWWLSLLKSIGGYHYWRVLVVITTEEYWWLSLLNENTF